MKTYVASRLSEGNKIYPCKISIVSMGVTLQVPSFFSGKETTIPFTRISAVDIDCPFVGYSSISIATAGEGKIVAHGFTKSEVKEMKELILENMK
jgi:hypothetical protein